jgi:hypothetical protein
MAENQFASRALHSVAFESFLPVSSNGDEDIVSTVVLTLASADGTKAGPAARLQFRAPVAHSMSVQDAKLAVLERALHLLRRLGTETPEALDGLWKQTTQRWEEEIQNQIPLGGGLSMTIKEDD